jgi:N4-gp56 family major capsid protein
VYGTLIFGAEFYAQTRVAGEAMKNIIKPLGSAGSADPLDQRQTTGWKATFVAVRLNEAFGVRIEHAVSA